MDYLEFFNLSEDPFRLTPDPFYFYPSQGHNEILSSLNYAIEQKEGFSLVTGEPGTGKTTILKVLIDTWKEKAEIALIMTPRLSPEEFLLAVLEDLNIRLPAMNKNEIIKTFRDVLIERSSGGKRVIIIVDEAQNLPDETLEELRLLSNLETEKEKLLQIILIGQPELKKRLRADQLKQLDQRITIRASLRPLNAGETSDYINYRLIKAGRAAILFDDDVKRFVYNLSEGIPRLINLISSRSLMAAYIEGSTTIRKEHVMNARRHLSDGPSEKTGPLRLPLYIVSGIVIAAVIVFAVYRYIGFQGPGPGRIAAPAATSEVKTTGSIPESVAPPPQNPQRTVSVVLNSVNLREGPSTDEPIISWAAQGATLKVTGELVGTGGEKWYRVKISDGRECWIAARAVEIEEK
jgi:general secretion pathway protein A